MNTPPRLLPDRMHVLLALCLLGIGLFRIAATYRVLSQAYDEPADVVAGMEWLDKGVYTLNLEHPPLSTVASAIGPYLAGIRLGEVPLNRSEEGTQYDLTVGGNSILLSGGKYWRNLALARLGMLPFFAVGVLVVFLWTREIVGGSAAVMAVLLFTTLPPILAFSGFAYTDLPVAVLIVASVFFFTHWLERPSLRSSLWLGGTIALAVLANFPALFYIPPCGAAAFCCWWWFGEKQKRNWKGLLQQAIWVTVAFLLVIWAGYRFSVQPIRNYYANPERGIASLHVPSPVKRVLQTIVEANPPVPAPALIKGITAARSDSGHGRPSYLFGHIRWGGWWYFYLVTLAVKTPLPFLVLAALGAVAMLGTAWSKRQWKLLVPAACAAAILVVTMPLKIDVGVRHILCIYPFLAILGGYGAVRLWAAQAVWRWPARIALIVLLAWQLVATTRAHPDYLSYFSELAGRHPENVLLWGCNYDCGQDTGELARLLRQHQISQVTLRILSSAEFVQLGFPPFRILNPYEQAPGWVAVSVSTLRTGDMHMNWPGTGNAPRIPPGSHVDAFKWLTNCQPVARAGKTIFLYQIPCEPVALSKTLSR